MPRQKKPLPLDAIERLQSVPWKRIIDWYRSEKEAGRAHGCSVVELSRAAAHMLDILKFKPADVAEYFGEDNRWVFRVRRVQLLCPEVQAMLDPALPKSRRLSGSDVEVLLSQPLEGRLKRAHNLLTGRTKHSDRKTAPSARAVAVA